MAELTLKASTRDALGSAASRRLRRAGLVPAVLYGHGIDPISVTVDAHDLYAALHTEAGLNAVINLDVNGDSHTTLPRQVQRHPTRTDIVHLDFVKISLTETVEAEVSIEFIGVPLGVREDGGIVETIRATVTLEALPTAIPGHIELNIEELEIGDVLRVSDLPVIEGVEYIDDPDAGLVTVSVPAAVVAEEAEEELEEGEEVEGEEAEEGAEEADGDAEEAEAEEG
jgi:large subunit ribosomal protein L25